MACLLDWEGYRLLNRFGRGEVQDEGEERERELLCAWALVLTAGRVVWGLVHR